MKGFLILMIIILISTFMFFCLASAAGLGVETAACISTTGGAIAIGIARHWPFEKRMSSKCRKPHENSSIGR